MPMKLPRRLWLASDRSCSSMPLFVSLNHHAGPCWILPGISSDWKAPRIVPICALSAGFKENSTVFGSSPLLSSALKSAARFPPEAVCAIAS